MAESEVELKSLLMKLKDESEKADLNLSIQKRIMASGPITSWHRDEVKGNNENSETILGGSKITADGDCSHEIKRCLLLGRKAMFFSVVMYGCESWTIKKAEHQRIVLLNCERF